MLGALAGCALWLAAAGAGAGTGANGVLPPQLAVLSVPPGAAQIFLVGFTGSPSPPPDRRGEAGAEPVWTPDRRRLAWVREAAGMAQVHLLEVARRGQRVDVTASSTVLAQF